MLKGEPLRFKLLIFLFLLNILGHYVTIKPGLQVALHTIILVYIGSIESARIYRKIESGQRDEKVETMTQKDAWMFPVFGSAVLFGLYLVFKLFDPTLINKLFHFYFSLIGTYTIACIFYDRLQHYELFKPMTNVTIVNIPKIKYIVEKATKVDALDVACFALASTVGLAYFFAKNWTLNNILGISFCVFGIENIMLGQFKVGFILLSLLFFYDIFWVFGTPVMVTVAKNLDGPIKLMFPKEVGAVDQKDFNMIGLGDIVIPGVFVALMLRFDITRHWEKIKSKTDVQYNLKNFKYFLMTLLGYSIGIFVTLFVMYYFQKAQPALLYLVPGCLIFSLLPAFVFGDFNKLWEFDEEKVLNPPQVATEETAKDK